MPMITTTMSSSIRVKPFRSFSMGGVYLEKGTRRVVAPGNGQTEGNAHTDICTHSMSLNCNELRILIAFNQAQQRRVMHGVPHRASRHGDGLGHNQLVLSEPMLSCGKVRSIHFARNSHGRHSATSETP
jgi:spore coat protein CotH